MNFPTRIIIFLILLIMPGAISFGQTAVKVSSAKVDQTELNELRARGYQAMYNLDYEEAGRLFKEMAQLFPDHPAGPQCLAATLWLQELNRSRYLQASLYNRDSFYTRPENQPDPGIVKQFHQLTREATLLAEARLRRNPRDVEALYFLGATEGLKAVFSAAVERRFIDALRNGSRSVERHQEVLKLDANFHDAELTIGMYNYIIGSLPLPAKILASISGIHGSKENGLKILEGIASEGFWARDIARSLLIDLYKREKRWTDALALSRELAAKYPRNYFFQLQAAEALMMRSAALKQVKGDLTATTDQREAFSIFESLLHEQAVHDAARPGAAELIHYQYGEALLIANYPEHAIEEFLAAARINGADANLITIARLRAAQSMDLAGRRSEALATYRLVLQRPNIYRTHEAAQRGLGKPYRR